MFIPHWRGRAEKEPETRGGEQRDGGGLDQRRQADEDAGAESTGDAGPRDEERGEREGQRVQELALGREDRGLLHDGEGVIEQRGEGPGARADQAREDQAGGEDPED